MRFNTIDNEHIIGRYNATLGNWGVQVSGGSLFWYYDSGLAHNSDISPVVNTWYHVAFSRSGTNLRVFMDGSQIGSTFTDSVNYNTATQLYVGKMSVGHPPLEGNLDEVRISKGVARWTSNFTPPTGPYTTGAATSAAPEITNDITLMSK